MSVVDCPKCNATVFVLADGTCPACKENTRESPEEKAQREERKATPTVKATAGARTAAGSGTLIGACLGGAVAALGVELALHGSEAFTSMKFGGAIVGAAIVLAILVMVGRHRR